MLYQPMAKYPPRPLCFRGGHDRYAGIEQASNYSVEAGAIYQGLFPSRPLDYVGLMVNELHYNNRFLNSLLC